MRPDSRSVSFTFHREILPPGSSPEVVRCSRNLRQRLQDRFDKEKIVDKEKSNGKEKVSEERDSTERGWNNLSLGNVSADSRRAFRSGAEKLSKTISSVRTTFGTISQKFRSSTRRRHRLDEQQSPKNSSCTTQTPQTRSRRLLGRTPTKLYSPFGIESPKRAWDKENDSPPSSATPKGRQERDRFRPFCLVRAKGFSALR
ncbi:uncharacterized protein LOC105704092 [Orussus abietinus]|uniref:uncharacterized protein LOC105704092 n=1 Tax=Orussus abietinus TaxID=222816 RepID=UPI0006269FBF|nr:uncharacterized protein LOC105704092 [Orussus abietinus]